MSGQQIDHLVKMANQIALNFGSERDLNHAASKTREHLKKFWTRDMRGQLLAYAGSDGADLSPCVRQMLEQDTDFEDPSL